MFKDNDSEHGDNNSINSIVENIDQIIDNDNNKGVEDVSYNTPQSSDEFTIPVIPLDYTKVHDSPVPPIVSIIACLCTDIDPIKTIKNKDISVEIYNVRHYNVGSYLFNKYIETIHVSTIYVDDCLLHIYNKGVVTTSKVKGLFTVLFKKPGLHNTNSQQLTYINNDISYLGINIFKEVLYNSRQACYYVHDGSDLINYARYFDVSFALKDILGLIDDGILIIAMICNFVYVKQLRYSI